MELTGSMGRTFSADEQGSEADGLENVFSFKVAEVVQEFVNSLSGTKLVEDHPDGYTDSPNRRFAAHHVGNVGDAINPFQLFFFIFQIACRHDSSSCRVYDVVGVFHSAAYTAGGCM